MGHGHGAKSDNRHDNRVNSFAIVKEGEINARKFGIFMHCLGGLPPQRGTVFRIKAILAIKEKPEKLVFHQVMDVSDSDDAGLWQEDEKKVSKIVFIGKSLDKPFLTKAFEDVFEQSGAGGNSLRS